MTDINYHTDKLCNYICNGDTNEALALIASGNFDSDFITDSHRNNALQLSISNDLLEVPLALIATERFDLNWLNANNMSALYIACYYHNTDVALALLATGQICPNHGESVLYEAIRGKKMYQVVYIIITGDFENSAINCKNTSFQNLVSIVRPLSLRNSYDETYAELVAKTAEIFGR